MNGGVGVGYEVNTESTRGVTGCRWSQGGQPEDRFHPLLLGNSPNEE